MRINLSNISFKATGAVSHFYSTANNDRAFGSPVTMLPWELEQTKM